MNNKTTKVVNIYPSIPITGVNPPIRSIVRRVTKSTDEIRTCLMARAVVEEITPDGKTVRLNIGNYNKCNSDTCTCGGNCGWKTTSVNNTPVVDDTPKTAWQVAYEKALEGKNLAVMSRKQRRSAEAAARAAADAATAEATVDQPEVVMGFATVETVNEHVEETAEEVVEETVEEEVVTEDVEKLPEDESAE